MQKEESKLWDYGLYIVRPKSKNWFGVKNVTEFIKKLSLLQHVGTYIKQLLHTHSHYVNSDTCRVMAQTLVCLYMHFM
jgi:hypothetical protein